MQATCNKIDELKQRYVALFQFIDLVACRLHFRPEPVNPAAVFHALSHFGAQHRHSLGATRLGDDAERVLAYRCGLFQERSPGWLIATDCAKRGRFITGHFAEHNEFRQRIRPQSVGAWRTPTLEHSPTEYKPTQWGRPSCRRRGCRPSCSALPGSTGMGSRRGVDAEKFFGQLVDLWQAFAQFLFADVAQVKMDHRAVWTFYRDGLSVSRARTPGSGGRAGPVPSPCCAGRVGRSQAVVLQIAIAILVEQEAAFAPARLRE